MKWLIGVRHLKTFDILVRTTTLRIANGQSNIIVSCVTNVLVIFISNKSCNRCYIKCFRPFDLLSLRLNPLSFLVINKQKKISDFQQSARVE